MKVDNKLISGVYLVERKWGLIWIKNKVKNINETVKDDKFYVMLLQIFTIDRVHKILEALSEEKKLIINFDNEEVKVVKSKDVPFHQSMKIYFNPQNIQNELEFAEDIDIYNYNKEENLW